MFRRLRLQLTVLYLLASVALVLLIGAGVYYLVDHYFSTTTDLALQHRMAEEFQHRGLAVPAGLASANATWSSSRDGDAAGLWAPPPPNADPDGDHNGKPVDAGDDAYNGEAASIFVCQLDESGRPSYAPGASLASSAAYITDTASIEAARLNSSDLRTVNLGDGSRARLLTYRIAGAGANTAAYLQVGRLLGDEDRLLNSLLLGLAGLAVLSTLLLGAASWWLAGRSLKPSQLAWERQQTFVANASHELRTPLTLARASTEVALRRLPSTDTRNKELLADVLHECDHMSRLVEDLLLLSRIDAGKLKLECDAVSANDLLLDMERRMGTPAAEKGVQLKAGELQGVILGDYTRLRQLLLILLDNAIRHTPAGGSIRIEALSQGHNIRLTVADTGEGIPTEHLQHIFDRFYRVDSARGAENGYGLGLSIAKGLVDAHHGKILVSSQVGRGTEVTLLLPAVLQGS